ncbi:MAG: hypothetical protein FWE08_02735 [Oscillospiraceae bacterium]|nr:hypothetical protein [Oscillospiraceae bacterium]
MIGFIKKYWKALIVFFVIGVIVIPICISLMFQINAPFGFLAAEWGASDALAFYSVLLGAGVAVWGVFLSIRYAQESYREDVRNRVLPFFTMDRLLVRARGFGLADLLPQESPINENGKYYEEYSVQEFYFTIDGQNISVRSSWTDEQKSTISNCGVEVQRNDQSGTWGWLFADFMHIPIKLKNIGLGSAVNFHIEVNPINNKGCFSRGFTIMPSQEAKFYIYIEKFNENVGRKYEIILNYYDIYNNQYEQVYPFEIKDNIRFEIDLSGLQKRVKMGNHSNGTH